MIIGDLGRTPLNAETSEGHSPYQCRGLEEHPFPNAEAQKNTPPLKAEAWKNIPSPMLRPGSSP